MQSNDELLKTMQEFAGSESDLQGFMFAVVNLLSKERPLYSWVGIYLLEGNELVLGPYVGEPSPHTRIPLNRGICGAAASTGETIIVDDVRLDPRFLACSIKTQAEIVVPIKHNDRIYGEIDIDSDTKAAFTADDKFLLEKAAQLLANKFATFISSND